MIMNFYHNLLDFKRRLSLLQAKWLYLILPTILAFMAALFDGISIGLLVPLLKGLIHKDFSFIQKYPLLQKLLTATGNRQDLSLIVIFSMVILLATIFKHLLLYLSMLSIQCEMGRVISYLRILVFNSYLGYGKLFFDRADRGYLANVVGSLTTQTAAVLQSCQRLLTVIFQLGFYLAIMFFISWDITCYILLLFPLLHYALKWLIEKIRAGSYEHVRARKKMWNQVYNVLACMPLIHAHNTQDEEQRHFAGISDAVRKIEFSMASKWGLIGPLQETIMLAFILLLLLVLAVKLLQGNSNNLAEFLVYFYVLKRASGMFGIFNEFKTALARVDSPIKELSAMLDTTGKFIVPQGRLEFAGLEESIVFKNLNFGYSPEKLVLKNISLVIAKGQTTAIVGATGAGKTTLIHLLLRFYDCGSGMIYLDGRDIREFTLASLRRHIALVSQDTLVFNDTIANNITYGLGTVAPERLLQVLQRARLQDFVNSLPEGLATLIGDRGVKLSGGERQRLAIARALLKGSEILILDEATCALDAITERLIQEAIEEALVGKTGIVIAHRYSTIKNSDKIIVIEDGAIAEQGAIGQLLNDQGRFYRYWQEQSCLGY